LGVLKAGLKQVCSGAIEVICKGLNDGREVGWVVFPLGEGVGDVLFRGENFRGVAFKEEAVGGDGAVRLEDGGFFRMKKVAGEGEAGTERGELGDEFGGAAERMEEETVGGWGVLFEGF